MTEVVFQRSGLVLDGTYLSGVHRFGGAKRLVSAELTCQPPDAGVLRLELEAGGVLTGLAFTVGPSSTEVRQSLVLGWPVGAGATIRWRASFSGTSDQAATAVSVTVAVGAPVVTPPVTGQVVWTDGAARVPLYSFTAAGGYVALGPVWRGAMAPDGSSIWLEGALVLSAADGGLQAAAWAEGGLAANGSRLEFWLGSQRVGVLTANGMQVRELAEGTPMGEGFTFSSGGVLTAALGTAGLTAAALIERQ